MLNFGGFLGLNLALGVEFCIEFFVCVRGFFGGIWLWAWLEFFVCWGFLGGFLRVWILGGLRGIFLCGIFGEAF